MNRIFVIGDVHGCLNSFKHLVAQLNLTYSDHLILLGDYVSKGPNPLGTLEYVIRLQENYQLTALIGNHDLKLLDHLINPTSDSTSEIIGLGNSVFTKLQESRKQRLILFLQNLPFYLVLEDSIFVHAGFDFSSSNPFEDKEIMTTIRSFEYHKEHALGKRIFHGHVPTPLVKIQELVSQKEQIIPLDNGCVYNNIEGLGNLLCLEVNKMKLIVQPNIG